jgi:hypothetical protein
MAQIDSGSKSSRLLASRRYTHDTLTTAQESFTNVLDLKAEEIYTRAHLIPSSSLPHSGSSQKGLVFTKSAQETTKYWFRQKLTKSNVNNEVWFFLNPTGSDDGVGAQLINDNQVTNFVSPKYAIASLATSTTEDSTPGYLAVLYKSSAVSHSAQTSSLSGDDKVSTNDYQFDYKTGIIQFVNSSSAPTDSDYAFMTVYQYVGDTLKTGLEILGPITASNIVVETSIDTTAFGATAAALITGSWSGQGVISGSAQIASDISGSFNKSAVSASFALKKAVTGSFALKKAVTGSFALKKAVSGSFPLKTAISGSFISLSSSLASRIAAEEAEAEGTVVSSSAQIATDISGSLGANATLIRSLTATGVSGSFISVSSSLASRIAAEEAEAEGTVVSSSAQIASDISGSLGTNATLIRSLTAAAISGSVVAGVSGSALSTGSFGKLEVGGNSTLTGKLTVGGRLTAQEFHTEFVSSSIVFQSGSTKFGDSADDTHTFTGQLEVSGSQAKVSASVGSTGSFGHLFLAKGAHVTDRLYFSDVGGEFISGDGTDLNITSGNDINIPTDIGLTFGDDGEKIEGNGTRLSITSGNGLVLDGEGDIEINADGGDIDFKDDTVPLLKVSATAISGSTASTGSFGHLFLSKGAHITDRLYFSDIGGEYISGDGTDLNLTSGNDINIPADIGLTFGNDGEKIEGDGTDMTIAASGRLILSTTNISGSTATSASFGRVDTSGDIYMTGRIYEAGTSVVDHATAMSIVFGG